jgi:PqqD family protein of HPr-rel-A system
MLPCKWRVKPEINNDCAICRKMPALPTAYVREENAHLIIAPLDAMTVIYHRRSGITHIVVDPVPQILASMDAAPATAADIVQRLAALFDVDDIEVEDIIAARLEEMAELGIVERVRA